MKLHIHISSANRRHCITRLLLIISPLIIALLPGGASAQSREAEADKIFAWARPETPGCACAVSQNGKVVLNKAYGSADLERNVLLSPNSIFDAGSLRKQFVAAAVLLLAEEKRVALSDDVRKYLPALPDYGHTITIDQLLTHTSGLRDWPVLLQLAGGDPDAYSMILRQRTLNFVPGQEWAYSNSGYVLATKIVEQVSGMSLSDFMQKRLFDKLGMKMTRYTDDMKGITKNRALAYSKAGNSWSLDMLLANDRGGAGALLTTAADLLIWNDALTSGSLGVFLTQKLQEPARLSNGRQLNYARGLMMEPGGDGAVWHTGGAAGYHSWLGRVSAQGLSIAVICNSDAVAASAIARRLANLYMTPAAGTKPPVPFQVSEAELNSRAGLFFNTQTQEPIRLMISNGTLRVQNGPVLSPLAADRFHNLRGELFFQSQAEFELQFITADEFELTTKEGEKARYARAQAYAPTAKDLQAFSGRFSSAELMAVFELWVDKNALMARLNDDPARVSEIKPVAPDTFQLAGMTLRFNRDRSGKVTGLDYSNPVLRKAAFKKLTEKELL